MKKNLKFIFCLYLINSFVLYGSEINISEICEELKFTYNSYKSLFSEENKEKVILDQKKYKKLKQNFKMLYFLKLHISLFEQLEKLRDKNFVNDLNPLKLKELICIRELEMIKFSRKYLRRCYDEEKSPRREAELPIIMHLISEKEKALLDPIVLKLKDMSNNTRKYQKYIHDSYHELMNYTKQDIPDKIEKEDVSGEAREKNILFEIKEENINIIKEEDISDKNNVYIFLEQHLPPAIFSFPSVHHDCSDDEH